ncbi:Thiol-disulfide oxidoreductase ResA [Novipirellula galeiformis]|uniref:Thiol-disulfide oxidoreductase ResA n=1 Tax=Novipirellula galeiformis TaxID=2528004 RepID=A0A5C6CS82_9BACT|nr:Thiol-disulfide oxidoreductase ResA [Novipirellula galeiformis]
MRVGFTVLVTLVALSGARLITSTARGAEMRVWLVDGGHVDGVLSGEGDSERIVCDSPLFVDPLQFDVRVVEQVSKKNAILGRRYRLRSLSQGRHDFGSPARSLFLKTGVPDWRRVPWSATDSLAMTLVADGVKIAGWLEQTGTPDSGRLVWQPALARNATELAATSQGKITVGSPRRSEVPQEWADALPINYRSGDSVVGWIQGIDSNGVSVELPGQGRVLIENAELHSVTLTKVTKPLDVDPRDLQRLLVVPRSEQHKPPLHVVVSVTGDLLRGTVVELSGEALVVQVRSKMVVIPRDRVAKIVWLRSQTSANESLVVETPAHEVPEAFLVHAELVDKRNVTLRGGAFRDQTLSGQSRALGSFSIALSEVKSIYFGRDPVMLSRDQSPLAWGTTAATVPRAYREPQTRKSVPLGSDSRLLGKPAPPLSLKTLDGDSFDLGERKGRVVVLDFWASWSAPSLRSLAEVSQVIAALGDGEVDWVAINLEESAESATRARKRVGVDATVLLDVDGDAAYVYQAKSLPHTVVIDRNGVVVNVIGRDTPKRLDILRRALQQRFAEPK